MVLVPNHLNLRVMKTLSLNEMSKIEGGSMNWSSFFGGFCDGAAIASLLTGNVPLAVGISVGCSIVGSYFGFN